jgi:hypothetical protein
MENMRGKYLNVFGECVERIYVHRVNTNFLLRKLKHSWKLLKNNNAKYPVFCITF